MKRLWCSLAFISSLTACGSSEHTYRTFQEARAANVFGRYLPAMLPASSKNIFVRHKSGAAGVSGAFCFDSRERAAFFTKLSDSIDEKVWGDDFRKTIPTLGLVGVHPLTYDSSEGHWVFFCADGNECTSCTWMKR
jgi:hypothetical protein